MKQLFAILVFVVCMYSCTSVDIKTFESDWESQNDRTWVGEDYWANPLKDWSVESGRLECINEQGGRNLQLITYQIGDAGEELKTAVFIGSLGKKKSQAGFRIGLKGVKNDYRYNCFFGKGLRFGIDQKNSRLFCFDEVKGKNIAETKINIVGEESFYLELVVRSSKKGSSTMLYLRNANKSKLLGELEVAGLKNEQFTGNIALFSNGKYWFDAWKVKGDRLIHFSNQKWGPILWSQYTLSRGTLNLMGLMAPIGKKDSQQVAFQVKKEGEWVTVATNPIEPLSRTVLFELQDWEDNQEHEFRLAYKINKEEVYWEGVIRKDPKEKKELSVAGFTGHKTYNFPNTEVVSNVTKHNPDLLFFSGDQIYEDNGGFGVIRKDVEEATLSYLSKYYMFGWSFGDLMRDRPSIILPDDHDVFYGNIWGDSGDGYFMPVDWVNMVQRTQTGHLPKAFDPTPLKNDIGVYYTDLIYGRVSFAILEDRKFKTQPTKIPKEVRHSEKRPDWVTVKGFDPEKVNDKKYSLLGERQLDFLEHWSSDWENADMKVSLSQTTFAGVATHFGSELNTLIADYDANGWPQHGRDKALEKLRKGFAFMFAGDTHLPTIVKHGVENWGDAGWAFCVPSITAGYPRAWNPGFKGGNHQVGMPDYTGEYKDGFGNKMTIWAVANPKIWMAHPKALKKAGDLELFKMKRSGYGIIRLAKEKGTIKMESYSLDKGPGETQMEGWPKVVNMLENDGRKAIEYLPELQIKGLSNPVLQVVNTADNEIVYTLRLKENNFIPKVYEKGSYSIKIGDPDIDVWQEYKNVKSSKSKGSKKLEVVFK